MVFQKSIQSDNNTNKEKLKGIGSLNSQKWLEKELQKKL
jgi:hypothetical protein